MVFELRNTVKSQLTDILSSSRGSFLSRINPTVVSLTGAVLSLLTAVSIIKGHYNIAFVFYSLTAGCDILDGAIARSHQRDSPLGTIIDGLMDRISDILVVSAIILAGITSSIVGIIILSSLVLIPYIRSSFERYQVTIPYGRIEKLEANIVIWLVLLFIGQNVPIPINFILWGLAIGLLLTLGTRIKTGFDKYLQKVSIPPIPDETTFEEDITFSDQGYAS